MDLHESFMERALAQARLSLPLVGINPPVGAVVARGGAIIAEGFHRGPGTAHAEIAAMEEAARLFGGPAVLKGASLYCTLEACCHSSPEKKTGPCTQAIIAAGIGRVVYACRDPNPLVSGRGGARLREAGIEVVEGVLEDKALPLLEAFSVSVREKRPFVRLKWAQSLDGRIACPGGASRWITSPAAREEAHGLRAGHDAVMVGAGTLRADDPDLRVRLVQGRDPLRVVMAGARPLTEGARLFREDMRGGTLVMAARGSPAAESSRRMGLALQELEPDREGRPALEAALAALYRRGRGSVLVEGGSALLSSFIKENLYDAITVFCAPLILGGGAAAVEGLYPADPGEGRALQGARWSAREGYLRLDAKGGRTCSRV